MGPTGGWPYTISTNATDGMFKLSLNEGFHAIHHYRSSCVEKDRAIPDQLYLFLLKVVRESHGCVVTAFYVHRAVAVDESAVASECRLKLAYESPCGSYRQESTFSVACTDLFGGLPSSDDYFEFVLPKSIHALCPDTIEISVSIDIND
ncbi:uncharacterized protein LOC104583225 [Brachypodium distachyon]|uniref:uncharacterized protein LOC104583225 n=1 Tax=Brachypodium distachyon TaxID=15368 RepID=UPI0005300842|nr:uncharacterized protein LOC104583225 [Brachypodium distachyon]|eukprot:XP_010233330.1 uncharacterized protein LOC104583225 [Brachypodium distachyon]